MTMLLAVCGLQAAVLAVLTIANAQAGWWEDASIDAGMLLFNAVFFVSVCVAGG